MARHAKTQEIIDAAYQVLEDHHPMTLRQVFYRLVSGQVLENTRGQYQALSRALVAARQEDLIPWGWLEDRLRRPREVSMWGDLPDFADTAVQAYRLDTWATQPGYLEVWLEKDALSGIFEAILDPYGVTLNVGRGYDGWTSIKDAAGRFWARFRQDRHITILYFGDFDPSGEDMIRSLGERLAFFHYPTGEACEPQIVKVALTLEDIARYDLPPNFTKKSDSRRRAFVAQHGDVSVELDALPPAILEDQLQRAVEDRLDLEALALVHAQEQEDKTQLAELLAGGGDHDGRI